MKKHPILFPLLFLLLTFLLLPNKTTVTAASANTDVVTDDAGLLTENEVAVLTKQIQEIASSSKINVRIYTVNTLNGKDGTRYLDDLEDKLNIDHAVFLLINMNVDSPSNRSYYINTFDETNKTTFNQSRRNSIRDAAIKKLKNGNYYEGLKVSLTMIQNYSKTNPRTDGILYRSWFQLLAALVISGLIVFYMAYTAGGKVTTNARTYLNTNTSRLLGHYDHYIRTTTTRTKRSNNSSGGGTHTTSGGHSSGSSSGNF